MRKSSELKFNPIKFSSNGYNGSIGTKTPDTFFRSTLSQNICYCVRNTAKTVNEIADALGVSPVYVEGEVEFLEEYGFLQEQKEKYIANFIIGEPTKELLTMQNEMYKRAAELFSNDLYEELISSGILDDSAIICNQTDEPISLTETKRADYNFMLWSLIPYIAGWSGEKLLNRAISFEEVATIRPDGAHNIFHADVVPDTMELSEEFISMKNRSGIMWNGNGKNILWQMDNEWSDRNEEQKGTQYPKDARRILSLYEREEKEILAKDDYVWLAERGYVKTNGDYEGSFKSLWQVVILSNDDIKNRLLSIGDRIKEKYKKEFDMLKAPYAAAVLETVPKHLKKVKEYELQFLFHSDGWFLYHCITTLLNNGKLKLPTESQRKSMTTLIFPQ